MRTFISYAARSKQKRLAGRIKKCLDKFGFNCFLAHEDILPQTHWPTKLEENLRECDLFLALLTSEYNESFYCQQEVGYASCRKVEILTILISAKPVGIIGEAQGIHFDPKKISESCRKIIKHVATIKSISEPVISKLIDEFGEANSYDDAGQRAKRLLRGQTFAKSHARMVMDAIVSNRQIAESRTARPYIVDFIKRHEKHLKPQAVNRYKRKW